MECQACHNQLSALIDGELPAGQLGLIESHLGSCPSCREEYESLRLTADLIDRLPPADVALPAWASIRETLLPAPAPGAVFGWDFFSAEGWAPATATVLALGLSLSLLVPSSVHRLELSQALETYVQQRLSEESLLETAWGLVDQRDLPNPFSRTSEKGINPFLTE